MLPLIHAAWEHTNRVWPILFGDGHDDADRRHVAVMAVADDLREDRMSGLSDAEEPDRQEFGRIFVAMRRQIELAEADSPAVAATTEAGA